MYWRFHALSPFALVLTVAKTPVIDYTRLLASSYPGSLWERITALDFNWRMQSKVRVDSEKRKIDA